MAKEAITGMESGKIRLVKVVIGEAPSTWADSMISPGSVAIYPKKRKIANGSPNPVWASHTPRICAVQIDADIQSQQGVPRQPAAERPLMPQR